MKLNDYLNEHNLSREGFAKRVGVSYWQIYRYCDKGKVPPHDVMEEIWVQTHKQVQPNDFYGFLDE